MLKKMKLLVSVGLAGLLMLTACDDKKNVAPTPAATVSAAQTASTAPAVPTPSAAPAASSAETPKDAPSDDKELVVINKYKAEGGEIENGSMLVRPFRFDIQKKCVAKEKDFKDISATIEVTMNISLEGKTEKVSLKTKKGKVSKDLEKCIQKLIEKKELSEPEDKKKAKVTFHVVIGDKGKK
jgi:hypothetical protein